MRSIRRLSEALWHGAPDDSRAAALQLVKSPDRRALAPLVGALGRHGVHHAAAARTLDRSGSTPDALRAAAAVGIGSAVATELADELVAIVDDNEEAPAVRAQCLTQVAGSVSPERLAELCLDAFESNDWRLRKVAVNTMPSGPLLGGMVESAVQDPDASVRYSAECRVRRP